jgi:hypothetical protein
VRNRSWTAAGFLLNGIHEETPIGGFTLSITR